MAETQRLSDNMYDLTLRLWSDHTPLGPAVSKLGLSIEYLAVMGGEAKGWKGRTRVAHCHYASLAHCEVLIEQDAATWLAATLEQLNRTATRFGPDIEALFWIAQLKGERVPSMVPDPALIARAVQVGARVFVENYTLPGDDVDIESPVKTWYPPN